MRQIENEYFPRLLRSIFMLKFQPVSIQTEQFFRTAEDNNLSGFDNRAHCLNLYQILCHSKVGCIVFPFKSPASLSTMNAIRIAATCFPHH